MTLRKQYGILIILVVGITLLLGCIAGNATLGLQEPPMLPTPDNDEISPVAVQNRSYCICPPNPPYMVQHDLISSDWTFLNAGRFPLDISPNSEHSKYGEVEVAGNIILFRNPIGTIYALTEDGTLQWEQKETQWERRLHELPTSTSTNMVFIRSHDKVIALDLVSGRENWNYAINASQLTINPENQEVLFVETHNEPHYMCALSASTGEEMWRYYIGERDLQTLSPVVHNETLIFQTRYSNLYALDSVTGREKWHLQENDYILSPPKLVQRIDDSGEWIREWVYQESNYIISPLLTQNNTLFFHCRDGFMYALDIQTGEERWRFQAEEGSMFGNTFPVLSHGMIVYDTGNSHIIAVNATSGSPVWRYKVHANTLWGLLSSDDTLYYRDYNGNLYALDCYSGEEKWVSKVDPWMAGVPVVSGGKVFVGGQSNGYLMAFDEKDGTMQWKQYVGGVSSPPKISKDRIIFKNMSGCLFSLDLSARDSALLNEN